MLETLKSPPTVQVEPLLIGLAYTLAFLVVLFVFVMVGLMRSYQDGLNQETHGAKQ